MARALSLFSCWVLAAVAPLVAQTPLITEYPLPTPGARPTSIIAGADGNIWFTEPGVNRIASISVSGLVREFDLPTPNAYPAGLTLGPDGNIWFTEGAGGAIGRINSDGSIAEFKVGRGPSDIVSGPDGNLWFIDHEFIGRMTTAGEVTKFLIYDAAPLEGIAKGSDGNLWFTSPEKFGKITLDGVVTLYPLSDFPYRFTDHQLGSATLGADGSVWTTGAGAIWRVSPLGDSTFFPTSAYEPYGIAADAAGNIWFTTRYGNTVVRLNSFGVMRDFAIPTEGSQPFGSTVGPDGNIWFTEQAANQIGVLNVSLAPPNDPPLATPLSLVFTAPADSQPAPQTLSIADSVTTPFSIFERSWGPWLFLSPSGDSISAQTIDVSASPKRLGCGPGVYAGAISLAAGPLRQTVTVQYRVVAPTQGAGCK